MAGAASGLVTVFFKDIVVLVKPTIIGTPSEMTWCRALTIGCGILAVSVAIMMLLLKQNARTTVMEVITVWGSLWPILLVAFLYGVTTRWASGKAVFVTMMVSGFISIFFPYVMYYLVSPENQWGFQWLLWPGLLFALSLVPILSKIWPNTKDLDGLTIYTTRKFMEENK